MAVRPADPADLDPLARIWYDGWQDAHLGVLPPALARRRTLDSFRKRLRTALATLRVVGPPAAPIGFCLVHGDELCQLYVAAASRGTGAAAALIADAESRMRDAGIQTACTARAR
jgi:GNAT superfamily N-acetyltransferase